MISRISLVRASPSDYPITLDQVKTHLRIDHTEFDSLIEQVHIPGALAWCEGETRRTLISRQHTWTIRDFPQDAYQRIRLPGGIASAVSSIVYVRNETATTLRGPSSGSPIGTDWQEDLTDDKGAVLMPNPGSVWPAVDFDAVSPVVITYTAGYTDVDQIPAELKLHMIQWVGNALDMMSISEVDLAGMVSAWRIAW